MHPERHTTCSYQGMLAGPLGLLANTAPWGWWSLLGSAQWCPPHLACSQSLCKSRAAQHRWRLQRGISFSWGSRSYSTLRKEDDRTWTIPTAILSLPSICFSHGCLISLHRAIACDKELSESIVEMTEWGFDFCRWETKFKTKLLFHNKQNPWVKSGHSPEFNTEAKPGWSGL